MSREEKLKAAKEKLVKFQKKRIREEKNSVTPVVQIIPINSSEDQNPEEPHVSTESFQELNLLPPAPSLEIIDQQEVLTIGNNRENVPNYYDLYISESNNCDMLSKQLHESQKAYQQVLNENEVLKNQITSLKTHLQNVLVTKSIEYDETNEIQALKSSLAKDSEKIRILEIEMAEERVKLEKNWSKLSEKEESLYKREKELINMDNELKQQQAQNAISDQYYSGDEIDNIKQQSNQSYYGNEIDNNKQQPDQNYSGNEIDDIKQQPDQYYSGNEIDNIKQQPDQYYSGNEIDDIKQQPDQYYSGNEIDDIKQQSGVNDNSLQWLEYYQGKCSEFEQINSQLSEQLQIYQNQSANHNQNEIILEEILNLKKDFKALFEPYEKINQIEEMNRKIVHILETSSNNAPSDFCKAIVELSRTNNHLLQFVSQNINVKSISTSNAFDQEPSVNLLLDPNSVRELVRTRLRNK